MIILSKPVRIFDSRDRANKSKVNGEEEIELDEIDDGLVAISLTVTATQPDGSGYVTVWDHGRRPEADRATDRSCR